VIQTRIDAELRRGSARITKAISARFGDRLQMWQGSGFPRSGTTVLCNLMSGYLDLPNPRHYRLPIAMPCVIQSHWLPYKNMPRTIYIVRDGRDALLSRYFYELHWAQAEVNPNATRRRKRLTKILGAKADLLNVRANLPRFIEAELSHPSLTKVSWSEHVEAWLNEPHDRVAAVRYEDLILNATDALAPAIESLTGVPTDTQYLSLASDRFEFRNMANQGARGTEVGPFMRKGRSGDWKDYFTSEACVVFEQLAGDTLRHAGYDELGGQWHPPEKSM
jgi:hypothetical protein